MDILKEFDNMKSAQKFIRDADEEGYRIKSIIVNDIVRKYTTLDENNNNIDGNKSYIDTYIYIWCYKKKNNTFKSEDNSNVFLKEE